MGIMNTDNMALLISAVMMFFGFSVLAYFVVSAVSRIRREKSDIDRLNSIFIRLLRPLLEILAPFNSKLRLKRYRESMEIKFRRSGDFDGMTVDMFLAFKEVSFIIGLVICLLVVKSDLGRMGYVISVIVGLGASYFPELVLMGYIANRKKKIVKELPYILDLLTVSVEAGLDFMRAIERVVKTLKKGELVRELSIAHSSLQMGRSREAVLRQLDARTEISDIKTFVSALIQADKLGTGIGATLRIVASQAREQRSQRAEALAGKATVKLLIPMVLVFGAVMLMVLGPVVIKILQTVDNQ